MRFSTLADSATALAGLLTCCQSVPAETSVPPNASAPQSKLTVTFDGNTKVYTRVSINEGRLGSLNGLEISATGADNDHLSLFVYGTTAGTYPYRQDVNAYAQTSQVEYQTLGTLFANYKARVCPTTSGYYSTAGQVVLESYSTNRAARGSFSGMLLNQNDEDMCSTAGKPFSGEFDVVNN